MKKINVYLIALFLIVLSLRLYFSFSIAPFSDDTSYLHIRNIDYIKQNISPMSYDGLSYGGKESIGSWAFYYFLTAFSFIPSYLKIIPQLLISLLIIIVYFLSLQLVKNEDIALFASFISGFTPLLIKETINKISIYSLIIPLVFYLVYCFLNLDNKKYYIQFLLLFLFLVVLHPISILFSLSLLMYILLKYTEDRNIGKKEWVLSVFAVIISLFVNFIIYFKAILLYGFDVLWKNTPKSMMVNTFNQISIFGILLGLGYISVILGIIGLYYGFRSFKSDTIFLISSIMLTTFLFLSFNVLDFYTALMFIGTGASILSSFGLYKIGKYIELTKLSKYKNYFLVGLFILILIFSFIPSINVSKNEIDDIINKDEIKSLEWIKSDANEGDIVFGSLYEGHIITYFSNNKNFFDTDFLMAPNPVSRLLAADALLNLKSSEMALGICKRNNIKYIFFSNKLKRLSGHNVLKYDDMSCFEKHDFVYKVIC